MFNSPIDIDLTRVGLVDSGQLRKHIHAHLF